jgi:SAM-dependent methyltransferase
MWKMRYYLPLVGFVLPTVVIGYGFVIPSSCIRGVNELSVGFGSTVFGAIVTYFAGIRAATRTACPARPPWRVRFARYVNRQASHPSGAFGWLLAVVWSFDLRKLNRATVERLEIGPTDDVLDVGCGPGTGVREAAKRAVDGKVTGLDVSETVLYLAKRRNRDAVRTGQIRFAHVDGADLGLAPQSLDRIFSVHSIYFWKDPTDILRQLAEALRPDGRLVLAFRPDGPAVPTRFRDGTYRFYTADEVQAMAFSAGFRSVRVVSASGHPKTAVWLVAERQPQPPAL